MDPSFLVLVIIAGHLLACTASGSGLTAVLGDQVALGGDAPGADFRLPVPDRAESPFKRSPTGRSLYSGGHRESLQLHAGHRRRRSVVLHMEYAD